MTQTQKLSALIESLEALIAILRADTECPWTRNFISSLEWARCIDPSDRGGLGSLSASIMSAYGGMGSFNDYVPPPNLWQKEMKYLEIASGRVYDNALALRVVGSY